MKTLTLKIDDTLHAQINALARRRRTTRSTAVRDALRKCLNQEKGSSAGSAFDLAKDLAGCLSGPPDLSVKKSHMRGFGR